MNNTIEILDKDTNQKQVYVLKEEPEEGKPSFDTELLLAFIRGLIKTSKFCLYVAISFLEMFLNVMKVIFNLDDYKPFKSITESFINAREQRLNKQASKQTDKYRIKFATEELTKHQYKFERSEIYNDVYKNIQLNLKDFADNNVAINNDIYKDILRKIDILTVEVEKKALAEGYNYAAFTKYRLSNDEVYEDFIQYKIMRGEGHGKIDKDKRESQNWW